MPIEDMESSFQASKDPRVARPFSQIIDLIPVIVAACGTLGSGFFFQFVCCCCIADLLLDLDEKRHSQRLGEKAFGLSSMIGEPSGGQDLSWLFILGALLFPECSEPKRVLKTVAETRMMAMEAWMSAQYIYQTYAQTPDSIGCVLMKRKAAMMTRKILRDSMKPRMSFCRRWRERELRSRMIGIEITKISVRMSKAKPYSRVMVDPFTFFGVEHACIPIGL